MNGVFQLLAKFGPARIAAMGAVTLALVGFFAFVILRLSQPAMGVLFSEMSPSDASAISRDLDARGVKYETRDDGQTILAPRSDVARLRMELAGKGLPSGGGVGYEIFDKGDAFSTTSFVQGINLTRALEGELARTIRTIGRVQGARVHLVLPEKRLFQRDREPPRASIVLKLRGELGSEQVAAIRHLVASAVEGLAPDGISIVDERGRLLANGSAASGPDGAGGGSAEDRRIALEGRLRRQVEEIVAGIVGPGRSRVQVAAELDGSRVESRTENFDPESRVVRSTQTRGETSATSAGDKEVTVGNELPGARNKDREPAAPRDTANKTEEVVNYEISRTTRTEVQGAGRLKRLSVAVLLDGTYGKGQGGGDAAYQARPQDQLDRIAALVRSAVGFDKARGDQVEVVNLPFAEGPALPEMDKPSWLGALLAPPSREDILRAAEIGIIALLTLLVLLVVVRPMVRQILAPSGGLLSGPAAGLAVAGGPGPAALAAPGMPPAEPAAIPALASVPAEQVGRLGDLARANPQATASVLKGWINAR